MLTFKNYNIADWISFSRIALAPVLLLLILLDERLIFSWLLVFTYCTDMLDGFVARRLKITSPRGSQLDSFGDQVNFAVAVLGLIFFEFEFIKANYLLILVVFVPYIIQMLIAFGKYGKATAFHTYLAKLSAIVQGVFILWLLFFGPVYWLFYVMIALALLETIEEIILIFMYDNWVSGVKGIYWALRDKRRLKKAESG
ncbi:MAG: CDP-alcohol phosphatidyltransferase family protein [Bacteroidetes bacterium]|nr:MAG: CDP-alcohol phosphatidyltransferase family protein [Bacteroidota bacterium]